MKRRKTATRRPGRPGTRETAGAEKPRGGRGELPPVAVLEVIGVDEDGVASARPVSGSGRGATASIELLPDSRAGSAVVSGDRVLARIEKLGPESYQARAIRRLPQAEDRSVVGIFRRIAGGGRLDPTSRRVKTSFAIANPDCMDARPGEVVRAETVPGRRLGLPRARVIETLGRGAPHRTASLIAIAEHRIPDRFPDEAIAEAESAGAAPLGQREDLRDIPLATVDGEDARDFDDAIWAEADPAGGYHMIVAIADVAWYVRPGSALDESARLRGNSVYFPDRVVPMLPEALSNHWCSLRPGEDRPCLAVHLWIDSQGRKRAHRFVRGLMRSAARLTYSEVQATIEGARPAHPGAAGMEACHLAFTALTTARRARGTLDLDIPERRISFAEDGSIAAIERRRTLDAHRLIEEFMIAANVAAAEMLEAERALCVYRVHDSPGDDRIETLREVLASLGLNLARGGVLRASHFSRLLERVAGTPNAEPVSEAILRAQAQAAYSTGNIGHFGLALDRYAHFTSPIRRYADLMVHRALIAACGLGEGGLDGDGPDRAETTARHISATERRAAAAERDAVDRLCAIYLADRVGGEFAARITGITRAGLFVRLEETGASALVPLSSLPFGPLRVDRTGLRLSDRRGTAIATLGDALRVRLAEVHRATGSLVCSVLWDDVPPRP